MACHPEHRHGYTVTHEYCGYPERRWVIRHYGNWVEQHLCREDAETEAKRLADLRCRILSGEAVAS